MINGIFLLLNIPVDNTSKYFFRVELKITRILIAFRSQTPNSGICTFNTGRIRSTFEGNFADPEIQGHFELRTDMWKNLKERGVHPGFCPQPNFDHVTYETEKTKKNPEGLIDLKNYLYNNNKMADEVCILIVTKIANNLFFSKWFILPIFSSYFA